MTINLHYVMILNISQWVKRNLCLNSSPFYANMLDYLMWGDSHCYWTYFWGRPAFTPNLTNMIPNF